MPRQQLPVLRHCLDRLEHYFLWRVNSSIDFCQEYLFLVAVLSRIVEASVVHSIEGGDLDSLRRRCNHLERHWFRVHCRFRFPEFKILLLETFNSIDATPHPHLVNYNSYLRMYGVPMRAHIHEAFRRTILADNRFEEVVRGILEEQPRYQDLPSPLENRENSFKSQRKQPYSVYFSTVIEPLDLCPELSEAFHLLNWSRDGALAALSQFGALLTITIKQFQRPDFRPSEESLKCLKESCVEYWTAYTANPTLPDSMDTRSTLALINVSSVAELFFDLCQDILTGVDLEFLGYFSTKWLYAQADDIWPGQDFSADAFRGEMTTEHERIENFLPPLRGLENPLPRGTPDVTVEEEDEYYYSYGDGLLTPFGAPDRPEEGGEDNHDDSGVSTFTAYTNDETVETEVTPANRQNPLGFLEYGESYVCADDNDDKCGICWNLLKEYSTLKLGICGHVFHTMCIYEMVEINYPTSNLCPMCRALIYSRPNWPINPENDVEEVRRIGLQYFREDLGLENREHMLEVAYES